MILLARHGETADNRERRFQGQGPVPLNARGREQAAALAQEVAGMGIASLYASPIPRARETALVVAEAIGLEPRFDMRFAETDTGDWTGRLMADVEREEPEAWAAYRRAGSGWRFPGGESLAEQTDRVVAALVDVTAAMRFPSLVVCHRGVIRVARCHTERRGLDVFHDIEVPNGSVVAL